MPCFSPLQGWWSRGVLPSGKHAVVFRKEKGFADKPVEVPCGQCIGCRLEKSRQWAVRCMHEAQMHEENCFITLTYDNKNLPKDGSVSKREFQLFMKKLRRRKGDGIRFFACGEYGERLGRPHYHACLFGVGFSDRVLLRKDGKISLYTSRELSCLWEKGYSTIGDVTFESAAYVARYVTKKVTGRKAVEHYCDIDERTGEILHERGVEWALMSRRRGIGSGWFELYGKEVYPFDEVIVRGVAVKPPPYYDALYEKIDPVGYKLMKGRREKKRRKDDLFRLRDREIVKYAQLNQLHRRYEYDD